MRMESGDCLRFDGLSVGATVARFELGGEELAPLVLDPADARRAYDHLVAHLDTGHRCTEFDTMVLVPDLQRAVSAAALVHPDDLSLWRCIWAFAEAVRAGGGDAVEIDSIAPRWPSQAPVGAQG